MKTGILSVPSGFRECFPSQNKFLSTKRLLEMVTLLITMFYSVICQEGGGDRENRPLYFNFLVPALSLIQKKKKKNHGICQKEWREITWVWYAFPVVLAQFQGERIIAERGCSHTHIIMALTMLTCNINWTIKGFKCSSLTFISLNFLKLFSFLLKLKMSIPFDFCTPSSGMWTKQGLGGTTDWQAAWEQTPQIVESAGVEFLEKSLNPSCKMVKSKVTFLKLSQSKERNKAA